MFFSPPPNTHQKTALNIPFPFEIETMDFSIAKKICVAYNICKEEDIMEPIQKRKNAVAFADAINSIEGVPPSPIARRLSDQWQ